MCSFSRWQSFLCYNKLLVPFFFLIFNLFIWLCWVLVVALRIFSCCMQDLFFFGGGHSKLLWHVGPSSLTRDWTKAPWIGSAESYPLDQPPFLILSSLLFVKMLCFVFLFTYLLAMACRILVPWPGIEFMSSTVKAQHPNHWTARELSHENTNINYKKVYLI